MKHARGSNPSEARIGNPSSSRAFSSSTDQSINLGLTALAPPSAGGPRVPEGNAIPRRLAYDLLPLVER